MGSERLSGDIEKVVNRNAETGWGVVRLRLDGGRVATLVGTLVRADEGLRVEAEGAWVQHPTFGPQFRAEATRVYPPHSEQGIERFLSSGAIHGVGPHFAKKIVRCFGAETLDVIRNAPRRMELLRGVGPKRVAAVIEGIRQYEADLSVMSFLFARFGQVRAQRIYDKYGREAREVIGKDPYRLMTELDGIGFALADAVASEVGMTEDHPQRLRAGVMAVLQAAAQRGHTCMAAEECMSSVEALLGAGAGRGARALEVALATRAVQRTERDGTVFCELEHYRWLEERIVERLRRIRETARTWHTIDAERAIPWAEAQVGKGVGDHRRAGRRQDDHPARAAADPAGAAAAGAACGAHRACGATHGREHGGFGRDDPQASRGESRPRRVRLQRRAAAGRGRGRDR